MARRLAQAAADTINGTQAEPWHDAPALLALVQEVAEGVGPGRAVLVHHLTDAECRARRVPAGATEPAIYVASMQGAPLAEFDAWDDGDCLHIRAHGMWAEVHHCSRPQAGA